MTYSAWDFNARRFAVYADDRQRPLMGDTPHCRPAVRPGIGGMIDIGMTLCPLPAGARPVGWSDVAVGQVVRTGGPASSGRAPGLGDAPPALSGYSGLGGGAILFSPGGAAPGFVPTGGLGNFSFGEAVIVNVLVSVVAGVISTFVFKSAFTGAGAKV